MIQFNLLPAVKLEYIKARRSKRLVMFFAAIIASASLVILVLLFMVVGVFQKKHLSDLNRDINTSISHIKGQQDVDKILTIQNQLKTLPGLHDQKPAVSRLFGYLGQITPANVSVSKLVIDLDAKTISISGGSDSLANVNKFVDTLKFTDFTVKGEDGSKKAFSNVVMSSFSRGDKEATYKIDLAYDPSIFDNTKETTLVVPNTITTRSAQEVPLFQEPKDKPVEKTNGN